MVEALVILVAERLVTPDPESCTTGLSAMASLKVAVMVTTSPCLTVLTVLPLMVYANDAIGAVLSTVKVAPEIGVAVMVFPHVSVPVAKAKVCMPSPEPTVQLYV